MKTKSNGGSEGPYLNQVAIRSSTGNGVLKTPRASTKVIPEKMNWEKGGRGRENQLEIGGGGGFLAPERSAKRKIRSGGDQGREETQTLSGDKGE